MMIKSIKLSKLSASTRNVRRRNDEEADLQLKADIEAKGLLQNLVVTPLRKPRGSFGVVAGGRRLRALLALASEGKLEAGHEVSCFVLEDEGAAAEEASLAENVQRLALNPADECLAFQQLVEKGMESEAIARRFGLTVRFVDGRLRLAGLAPVVFEALGAGEISLDVAKAYAATPDRDRQADVFEQASRSYMGNHPDSIRRLMTQATIPAGDRRALFVGEEAYLAEGGRVERDLFADEGEARWLDVALVERLALEKLERLAAGVAAEKGLAFVHPTLESWVSYSAAEGLRRVPLSPPPLSDEEKAEAEALEAEIEEIAASLEDEEMEESAQAGAEARLGALGEKLDSIFDKAPVIPDALEGRLGAFLMIDAQGQARLDSTFYASADPDSDTAVSGESEAGAAGGAEKAKRPAGLPRRLVDELAIQRRDLLALHVERDPAFALDLAIFLMADRQWGGRHGSSLSAAPASMPLAGFSTPDAPATIALAEAGEALDRSWTDSPTHSERFDAFRALPQEKRMAWLGHVVARTLEASAGGERSCPFHDHLGTLLGIDVAHWWRPTGANYFDRAPKAFALAALGEVGGPTLAEAHSKAKKAALSHSCERIFAGDFIAEVEVKKAALSWVPPAMRFAEPAQAGAGEAGPGSGDEAEDPSAADPVEAEVLEPSASSEAIGQAA